MGANVSQDSKRLIFSGALVRDEVGALFHRLASFNVGDIDVIDLRDVSEIDSAGLAMLSLWIETHGSTNRRPMLVGETEGLTDLRAAYRLTEQLEFARSN